MLEFTSWYWYSFNKWCTWWVH